MLNMKSLFEGIEIKNKRFEGSLEELRHTDLGLFNWMVSKSTDFKIAQNGKKVSIRKLIKDYIVDNHEELKNAINNIDNTEVDDIMNFPLGMITTREMIIDDMIRDIVNKMETQVSEDLIENDDFYKNFKNERTEKVKANKEKEIKRMKSSSLYSEDRIKKDIEFIWEDYNGYVTSEKKRHAINFINNIF